MRKHSQCCFGGTGGEVKVFVDDTWSWKAVVCVSGILHSSSGFPYTDRGGLKRALMSIGLESKRQSLSFKLSGAGLMYECTEVCATTFAAKPRSLLSALAGVADIVIEGNVSPRGSGLKTYLGMDLSEYYQWEGW